MRVFFFFCVPTPSGAGSSISIEFVMYPKYFPRTHELGFLDGGRIDGMAGPEP